MDFALLKTCASNTLIYIFYESFIYKMKADKFESFLKAILIA